MKRRLVRVGRLGGGALLILMGVVSGFLPVLQGWIFILAGLTVMAPESRRARRWLDWARQKVRGGLGAAENPGRGAGDEEVFR